MQNLVGQGRTAEMIDVRMRIVGHGVDECDGVHQRICSLRELYDHADGAHKVMLKCWRCGHEAELEDIEQALEKALFAMADEVQRLQRKLYHVRARNQAQALRRLIDSGEPIADHSLVHLAQTFASQHLAIAKQLAQTSIVDR